MKRTKVLFTIAAITGVLAMSGCENFAEKKINSALSSEETETEQGTEEVTSEEATDSEITEETGLTKEGAEERWQQFLTGGDYTGYVEEYEEKYSTEADLDYITYDLNGDDIPELIIETHDIWFTYSWLFELDEYYDVNFVDGRYGYASYEYSPSQNLIFAPQPFKPFAGTSAQDFYTLEDFDLVYQFEVGLDGDDWFYSDNEGNKSIIDNDTYSSYFEDFVQLDWQEMPEIISVSDDDTDTDSSEDAVEEPDVDRNTESDGDTGTESDDEVFTGDYVTKDMLVNYYWKQDVQYPALYDFRDDGTYYVVWVNDDSEYAMSYDGYREAIANGDVTYEFPGYYELEDGVLTIKDELDGDGTKLYSVKKSDNYDWDMRQDILEDMNEDELFLYDITWNSDDDPYGNAVWFTRWDKK